MKEDYLWDKTGKDPEIEKLENALKAFRRQDSNPPALPVKTPAFEKAPVQSRPRYFQFAFASFASLALVVISLGVFQLSQNDGQNLAGADPEKTATESTAERSPLPVSTATEKDETLNEEKIAEPEVVKTVFKPRKITKRSKINRKKLKRKPIYKKAITPNKSKRVKTQPKVELSELTAEEKYAYDQLMKALAITSSNLRIVRDKVNGVEKPIVRKSLR